MAKITLRAYNREIEGLIDAGHTDEAIAHCKYLLKIYPKHIDTYRLLGKAYLEAHKYGEATDVLQRVLSSIPDDFVSQIGLSIIREDEGNLDAAIYHMEHAFEVQPSNSAVQEELRRLYGRRDGIQPPRVRLTRGALVRMYARGELYAQAIAEIRAALAEDSKRVDLEIILARMYFLSGEKVEAAEICSRVVSKFPYSYEANRILSEILPNTSRAQDAKIYQQRIIALDPYAAFLSVGSTNVNSVPDIAIVLERLEYSPEMLANQQSEWSRTTGAELQPDQEESIPDWLKPGASEESPTLHPDLPPQSVTPENHDIGAEPLSKAVTPQDEAIPEWMRAAGWEQSSEEEEPISSTAEEPSQPLEEAEAAPAEIPDWLQSLAPEKSSEPVNPSTEEIEKLDQLQQLLPLEPSELSSQQEEPQPAEEIPAWLQAIQAEQQPSTKTDEEILPVWLREETPATPEELSIQETAAITPEEKISQPTEDWLESLKADVDADQATLITPRHKRTETPPAWVQQPTIGTETELEPVASLEPPTEEKIIPTESLPEVDLPTSSSTQEINPVTEQPDQIPVSTSEAEPAEEIPDWLAQIRSVQEDTVPPEIPPQPSEEKAAESLTQVPPSLPETKETVQTEEVEAQPSTEIPAWLQEIAPTGKKTGEEEKEILPEEIEKEMPDWLRAISEQQPPQPEQLITEQPLTTPEQELPGWLMISTTEQETPSESTPVTAGIEAEEEIPDWLYAIEEPAQKEPEMEVAQLSQKKIDLPGWLWDLEAEIPEEALTQTISAEIELPQAEGAATELAQLENIAPETSSAEIFEVEAPSAEIETVAEEPSKIEEIVEVIPQVEGAASELAQLETIAPETSPAEISGVEAPSAETETIVEEPSKIEEIVEEIPQAEVEEPATSIQEIPQETTPAVISQDADIEQAPTWLEALAAKHGVEEEPLLVKPEESQEVPPEWVFQPEEATSSGPSGETSLEILDEESTSDGILEETSNPSLEEISSKQPDFEVVSAETPESDIALSEAPSEGRTIPDWLQGIETAETPGSLPDTTTPDWMKGLEGEITSEEVEAAIKSDEEPLPDWLAKAQTEERSTATPEEITEIKEAPRDLPAWLTEIEQPQEVLPTGEGKQQLPDWLPELEQPATEAQTPAVEVELPKEEKVTETPSEVEVSQPVMLSEELSSILSQTQDQLMEGDVEAAIVKYQQLIENGEGLDEVIQQLIDATYRYPVDTTILQTLGDAYFRSNRLQAAIDAYTKAEELLR